MLTHSVNLAFGPKSGLQDICQARVGFRVQNEARLQLYTEFQYLLKVIPNNNYYNVTEHVSVTTTKSCLNIRRFCSWCNGFQGCGTHRIDEACAEVSSFASILSDAPL